MIEKLLWKSSQPYFEMLQLWVFEGKVNDPYNEFFIEVQTTKKKSSAYEPYEHCESKFKLIPEKVPEFLKTFSQKILNVGKYLNAFSNNGLKIKKSAKTKIEFSKNEKEYHFKLEEAYLNSSAPLVEALKSFSLLDHLRSVQTFFLCKGGDLIGHFMESAADELNKESTRTVFITL